MRRQDARTLAEMAFKHNDRRRIDSSHLRNLRGSTCPQGLHALLGRWFHNKCGVARYVEVAPQHEKESG